jgi:hypothetical protein
VKPTLSLALIAALIVPTLPTPAEAQPLPPLPRSNWYLVGTISAGTPIQAAYVGRRQGHQYFISATDDVMTILMPDRLPRSARKALIEIASTTPRLLTGTTWFESTVGSVRVTPDGIFVKKRRIAAVDDVVITIARKNVAEVSQEILVPHHRRPQPPYGPDPGAEVGALSGVASGLLTAAACKDRCPAFVLLAGFIGPIVAVPFLLSRQRDREIELVYRAP